MNKSELVENVQKSLGDETTKRAAEEAVEAVLGAIAQGIRSDRKVQIVGFGTFDVKERAARQGRNPKTGVEVPIEPRRVMVFKPSNVMKARINGLDAVSED
jgi:nucleoid DNA-binding protein